MANATARFLSLLCSTALCHLIGAGEAAASQYVPSIIQSVTLKGYVEDPATLVTVLAEADVLGAGKTRTLLRTLRVSYNRVIINVPSAILGQAPSPRLNDISLTYAGCNRIYDNGGQKLSKCSQLRNPCMLLIVKFGVAYAIVGEESKWPYLSVSICDGKVDGYSAWHFDGKDWVAAEYKWIHGKASPIARTP
jgi:hypothetical protein